MHLEIENLKIQYGLKSKAAVENINLGKVAVENRL
jgi:hypothetical protein